MSTAEADAYLDETIPARWPQPLADAWVRLLLAEPGTDRQPRPKASTSVLPRLLAIFGIAESLSGAAPAAGERARQGERGGAVRGGHSRATSRGGQPRSTWTSRGSGVWPGAVKVRWEVAGGRMTW